MTDKYLAIFMRVLGGGFLGTFIWLVTGWNFWALVGSTALVEAGITLTIAAALTDHDAL